MALTVPSGLRVANTDPVDDRIVFDTVANALAEVGEPRRRDGLAIWITSEKLLYRFVGGTADTDFVQELSISEVIEKIIETVVEKATEDDSELLEKLKELFWTKAELMAMTQAEVTATPPPVGTIVLIKES
jgi:hypothetical protein